MTKLASNNAKNISIGQITFEFNYHYLSYIFYEKDIDPCSKSKSANELSMKFQELMTLYKKNLHHTSKF